MDLLEISDKNGIRTISINNLKKKNAINKKTYFAIAQSLNEAGLDSQVKAVVLTGKGNFFRYGLCTSDNSLSVY